MEIYGRTYGSGCPRCAGKLKEPIIDDLLIEEWSIKNDKLISCYTTCSSFIAWWKCKICGDEFKMKIHKRTIGRNCLCVSNKTSEFLKFSSDQFEKLASKTHKNKYTYSGDYITNQSIVTIICPNHGKFHQIASSHLFGNGCLQCGLEQGESKTVTFIRNILDKMNILYSLEQTFNGLKYKKNLRCDIYIPHINLVIEYDGEQHFKGWSGNKNNLKISQHRDLIKDQYCLDNNINMIRIPYYMKNKDIVTLIKDSITRLVKGDRVHSSYFHYIKLYR